MLRIFLLSMYIAMANGVIVPKAVQIIAWFLLIASGAIEAYEKHRIKWRG